MKRHSIFSLGLALLGASMLLSGCLTNKVGVRHDGTLAIALNEEGDYQNVIDTATPNAWDIYVTDPQGSTLKRLTYGDELKAEPVWSPDGRWIAYIAYHLEQPTTSNSPKKENFEIWVMREDGEEPRKVYETSKSIDHVIWSPQGGEVGLFQVEVRDSTTIHVLTILDAFTGELIHQLQIGSPFAWSPDGDQLIYAGRYEEVVRLDLNTGSREVLFEGFQSISALNWLQDGRLIFTGGVGTPESKPTIYTYDIASGSLAALRADAVHQGVSPGGQRLLMFVKTGEKEGSPVLVTRRLDGVGGDEVVTEGKTDFAFWISDETVGYLSETETEGGIIVVDLASGDSVNLTQRLKEWF